MTARKTILMTVAVCLFGIIVLSSVLEKSKSIPIKAGERFAVKRIRVISGCEFDLLLTDNRRIHGQLKVITSNDNEVTRKVVALLNTSVDPEVELVKHEDNLWIIELYFNVNGSNVILSEWLKQNRLVWE